MTWLPGAGERQKAVWSLGHRYYNIPRAEGEIYALLSCVPCLVRSACPRKERKKKKATSSLLPSPTFTKISHQDKGGIASFQTNSWQSRPWMEDQNWSKLSLRLPTLRSFTFIPLLRPILSSHLGCLCAASFLDPIALSSPSPTISSSFLPSTQTASVKEYVCLL